jgi:hypothetical protein
VANSIRDTCSGEGIHAYSMALIGRRSLKTIDIILNKEMEEEEEGGSRVESVVNGPCPQQWASVLGEGGGGRTALQLLGASRDQSAQTMHGKRRAFLCARAAQRSLSHTLWSKFPQKNCARAQITPAISFPLTHRFCPSKPTTLSTADMNPFHARLCVLYATSSFPGLSF